MTILAKRPTSALTPRAIGVKPFADGFGADIEGFDFQALEAGQLHDLKTAWLTHGVVRFRGSKVTDEQQIAFTAALGGGFGFHPAQAMGADGAHDRHKEILVIGNAIKDGRPAGTMANNEAIWHSDTYIYETTPAAAILRALQLPPEGGDTQFADMYEVYNRLPFAVRSVIEGRMMQADVVFGADGKVREGQKHPDTDDIRLWPGMRHPIVRTHGESLRNCVYVGADVPSLWIVGLPLDESRAILDEIFALVKQPEVQWTQVWKDNDILMWDNRCTMHRRDGWPAHYTRVMHRTTTMGERPFYRC